ncbi:MAG TPA: hypothetical protein VHK90_00520 [Thermoanaerobaculia bacterium]|nr:hypothetical protein [Thermoanaerobaculia bacterium]
MRRVGVVLALLLLAHCASDRVVRSTQLPLAVSVAPPFRHAGSQTFVLRGNAEVEQHLFFDPEARRIVWIQYERYLPGVDEEYAYDSGMTVQIGGVDFDVSTREYQAPPDPGSDRDYAFRLLAAKGFRLGEPATRVRFVHVPAGDRRSELMIIYAESGTRAEGLLDRARASFTIVR